MDLESRIELIKRPPTEEIITEEELRELLEGKKHVVAYDGFEPSGLAHLGSGLLRAIKLKDFLDAKIDFIIYIADWFAYLNNKFGGDLEAIRTAGKYLIEAWKACGVDTKKVKIVWTSEMVKNPEYWEMFLKISKLITIKRILRAVTITGRTEAEVRDPGLLIYPLMQATDIFMLNNGKGVDICQLGMDQRKVNMLAREIAEKLGRKKPVAVHHHLLLGLKKGGRMGSFDENEKINEEISLKMSKSKPDTAIFIHDTEEEIRKKILNAWCPPKQVQGNPVLEIAKYIIFRKFGRMIIKRKAEYGGNLEVLSYEELEKEYRQGLHPLDLKLAVSEYLNEILKPVREYFKKNEKARRLYESVKERQD